MKKKKNKELSAGTKADRSTQDQLALSVRRHNTKPDVTCSQSVCQQKRTYVVATDPYRKTPPVWAIGNENEMRKWLLRNGPYKEVSNEKR